MSTTAAVSTGRIVKVLVQKYVACNFAFGFVPVITCLTEVLGANVFLCKINWGNPTTKCNGGILRKFILIGCYLGFILKHCCCFHW